MKPAKAFTLIELLIVVAIIAILAAIAVPNFLEAQTRSKISRAQADMRSQATAIEAYRIDNNRYNPGYMTIRQGANVYAQTYFPTQPEDRLPYAWKYLTTPIAYMTSTLIDPFTVGDYEFDRLSVKGSNGIEYWYDDYQQYGWAPAGQSGYVYSRFLRIVNRGYVWSISSGGPEKRTQQMWMALDGEDLAAANGHIIFPYDPSNGTISEGFVARTSRGVYKEVHQTQ